jgi:hypothetical protein
VGVGVVLDRCWSRRRVGVGVGVGVGLGAAQAVQFNLIVPCSLPQPSIAIGKPFRW